ncbi:MAG: oligosaccharide flippase family protein [Clostridia bacterium]
MRRIFKVVFLVTAFSIITRALGFIFRIYLSRELGAVALGEYQIAMSVFGVVLTLISSGLPLIVSRSVASSRAKNNKKAESSIVSSGLIISVILCILISVVVIFFPKFIERLFASANSASMLIILLPALIFSSPYTIFRGAMWGQKRFFAISFTELFEQVVRMIICAILFALPLSLSMPQRAGLSLSIACIFSGVLCTILYFTKNGKLSSPKNSFKHLLCSSTPITSIRTASSLVTSFIALIIPLRLMASGISKTEALAEFGIASGMTLPLIMIPCTLIGSLAVAMLPEISAQTENIDKKPPASLSIIKKQISLCLSFSIIIAMCLVPAYMSIGTSIGISLFSSLRAGKLLVISAWVLLPLGVSHITGCILNAIGLETKSLINYIISAIFLIICILVLPAYIGIYSLVIGLGGMYTITAITNLAMLSRRKLIDYAPLKTLTLLIVAILPIALITKFLTGILLTFLPCMFATIIGGLVSIVCYGLFLMIFNIADFNGFITKQKKSRLLKV